MKAVHCTELGLPEHLRLVDIDPPPLQAGHVRVRVHACSVNYPDTLMIQGQYQFKPELPFSPGSEVGGEITEIADDVTGLGVGDRVMALCGFGGFAEEVVAAAHAVLPIPAEMPFNDAAAFLMTYGTSYYALKQRAQLQPGETVLVLGAAGGVGLTAVELAKVMGAKVIAAASSQAKLDLAKQYGADEVINYSDTGLKDAIKSLTGGQGVDVLYDPIGGEMFEQAFRAMAWNGRALVIGFVGGIPALPLNLPLLKGSSVVGVFWGAFTGREAEESQRNNAKLLQLYSEGRLKPCISRCYSLEESPQALEDLMNRSAMGKLVIEI